MIRISAAALALAALGLAGAPALAQTTTPAKQAAKPATKVATKPGAKAAPKPASSKQKLDSEAKGLALASDTVETITTNQLDIAARVMTGDAQCEFNQTVKVEATEGRPGHFNVAFKNLRYVMVPEETTTGAVRLTDKKAGVVWLQIPFKSMLMNAKVGQRLVDSCLLAEQRAATMAAKAAAASLPPASPVLLVAPGTVATATGAPTAAAPTAAPTEAAASTPAAQQPATALTTSPAPAAPGTTDPATTPPAPSETGGTKL